jgi:DNA polymerase III subunit delta'
MSSPLDAVPEQEEAKSLLRAALPAPAHAYLFHGPRGVGKRRAALAFAAELLAERDRVLRGSHPDLYVLEPLGDQIRIDDIRLLHHDLHMRPYEAGRRVYIVLAAQLLNEEAADALLKDLEEPPPYAVLLLLADDLGPLPDTIRSRCQHVPFTRLSEGAIREEIADLAEGLSDDEVTALVRVASGRLDRAERLLDPKAVRRRAVLLEVARRVYTDPELDPADAAEAILEGVRECGAEAKAEAEAQLESMDLPAREGEQRVRRALRGAEQEELFLSLEELAAWYRDLVVVAAGAEQAVIHYDHLDELRSDATEERAPGAEDAAEAVRATWRIFEELNVQPRLALEALFVQLRRALAGTVTVSG